MSPKNSENKKPDGQKKTIISTNKSVKIVKNSGVTNNLSSTQKNLLKESVNSAKNNRQLPSGASLLIDPDVEESDISIVVDSENESEMDTESSSTSTSSQNSIKKRPTKRQNSKDSFEASKKRTRPSDQTAPSIPTTNEYSILQNNDQEINSSRIVPTKVPTPPPIIIKKPGFYEVYKLLTKDHKFSVTFKSISLGCKVFTKNSADYDKILELCNVSNFEYFTHQIKDQRPLKFVLRGLCKIPVEDIIEDLRVQNIIPISVMHITRGASPHTFRDEKYLVQFDPKKYNISQIKAIRVILHQIVSWDKPARNTNLTQCHKCQEFGHGIRGCHLPSKCLKCCDNHLTTECQKPMPTEPENMKCASCNETGHLANSKTCKNRLNYLKIKESVQAKNNKNSIKNKPKGLTPNNPPLINNSTSGSNLIGSGGFLRLKTQFVYLDSFIASNSVGESFLYSSSGRTIASSKRMPSRSMVKRS